MCVRARVRVCIVCVCVCFPTFWFDNFLLLDVQIQVVRWARPTKASRASPSSHIVLGTAGDTVSEVSLHSVDHKAFVAESEVDPLSKPLATAKARGTITDIQ